MSSPLSIVSSAPVNAYYAPPCLSSSTLSKSEPLPAVAGPCLSDRFCVKSRANETVLHQFTSQSTTAAGLMPFQSWKEIPHRPVSARKPLFAIPQYLVLDRTSYLRPFPIGILVRPHSGAGAGWPEQSWTPGSCLFRGDDADERQGQELCVYVCANPRDQNLFSVSCRVYTGTANAHQSITTVEASIRAAMSRRAMAMVMFALCFLSEQLRAELQENQCLQTTRAYSLDLLMCGQRKPARAKMCSAVNISHTSTDRATKAVSVLAQESVDWIADRLFLPQVPL